MHVDANGVNLRDCEGIAYVPATNTVFISGEGDQQILEYNLKGELTGRRLNVPEQFGLDKIVSNYGFEALTYSPQQHAFWTMTESMLVADGQGSSPVNPGVQNLLRLLKFGDNLQPAGQYAYRMDRGRTEDFGRIYAHGVSDVTMLPSGKLLVLEREANITSGYMGSEVNCKVFMVNPQQSWPIDGTTNLARLDNNKFMVKHLLANFQPPSRRSTRAWPIMKACVWEPSSTTAGKRCCSSAIRRMGRATASIIVRLHQGAGASVRFLIVKICFLANVPPHVGRTLASIVFVGAGSFSGPLFIHSERKMYEKNLTGFHPVFRYFFRRAGRSARQYRTENDIVGRP